MSASESSLASQFSVRRRYARSINIERDIDCVDMLDGYVVSPLAVECTKRVSETLGSSNVSRAWTLTGVYGTGKSAFAQFLCALAAAERSSLRAKALELLAAAPEGKVLVKRLQGRHPPNGYVRAVATAQREPLSTTILRALDRGASTFWDQRAGRRPAVLADIHAASRKGEKGTPARRVLEFVEAIAEASGSGLFLIVDELGKSLEHAARHPGAGDDVFLLQQLAELCQSTARPIVLVGLLHQGFGEYGAALGADRRAEWSKVQGRFEDIAFSEPPDQLLRLIGRAVSRSVAPNVEKTIWKIANGWQTYFSSRVTDRYLRETMTAKTVADCLPLHPVSALVLPILCAKYGQNDRSLFTFLASNEPHAFSRFLNERHGGAAHIPAQRLDDVYDYFAGIAGQSVGFRPQFQRWAEIHGLVSDARKLDPDSLLAIKVVAALNLAGASGPVRASHSLTIAALIERPDDSSARRWEAVLASLKERGLITYRKQLDEFRLWEGSDYDVEAALMSRRASSGVDFSAVLTRAVPLTPIIAQRHSYRTGTTRYFEARYVGHEAGCAEVIRKDMASDGVLLYWVGDRGPTNVASETTDGRPVVVVETRSVSALAGAATEYSALEELARSDPHLQSDGVARREVHQRLRQARSLLDRAVRESFYAASLRCHIDGEVKGLSAAQLRGVLSGICDRVYAKTPRMWNELINRRELTSQGARAQRELIEAMVISGDKESLGLSGNGPETSMYISMLRGTGIHRDEGARWAFNAPTEKTIAPAWDAIVTFCRASSETPRGLDELVVLLEAPPFGLKRGLIPVLLAAVLLAEADSVSVFRDGTFLPSLGAEQFELLVKHPARFSVKFFALDGIRADVFHDLEDAVGGGVLSPGARNATVLSVVRPLVRFAQSLPPGTQKTQRLSERASAVREVLRIAREPDSLLFRDLPTACGLEPFGPGQAADSGRRAVFREAVRSTLRELQSFHLTRRESCRQLLNQAFGTADPSVLRGTLRARVLALPIRPLEERLRAFSEAVTNSIANDDDWLESVIMVVSDRPLKGWADEDEDAFESRVSDLARRFSNLEALVAGAIVSSPGMEVRRITLTAPTGEDIHRVIRVGTEDRTTLEPIWGAIAAKLRSLPAGQRESVLALVAESILREEDTSASNVRSINRHG